MSSTAPQETSPEGATASSPEEAAKAAAFTAPRDYVPSLQSAHALYQINLEAFCGPLDLLLFLIRRHEIDIFNIPIGFICSQYLDCLRVMADLNLDVASEFMYVASELLQIKSQMLLPKPKTEAGEEEEEDPRAALVARLLEYQKYRDAAEGLVALPHLGRDVFARPPCNEPLPKIPGALKQVDALSLARMFSAILDRRKPEIRHQVVVEHVSVKNRMVVLATAMAGKSRSAFADLLGQALTRLDVIVTFLALLELSKMRLCTFWEDDEGGLFISPTYESGDDAIDQVVGRIAGVEEEFAG